MAIQSMHNGYQNPLNSNRSQTFPSEMIEIVDPSRMGKSVKLQLRRRTE